MLVAVTTQCLTGGLAVNRFLILYAALVCSVSNADVVYRAEDATSVVEANIPIWSLDGSTLECAAYGGTDVDSELSGLTITVTSDDGSTLLVYDAASEIEDITTDIGTTLFTYSAPSMSNVGFEVQADCLYQVMLADAAYAEGTSAKLCIGDDGATFATACRDIQMNFLTESESEVSIRDAVGLASASLDTQLSTIDTEVGIIDGNVDDTETNTATIIASIGTSGDALTDIPWNSDWDADAQSEVADALVAYDPPTDAELDTLFGTLPDFGSGADLGSNLTDIEALIDDLETRLTATRAGYLDNLNTGVDLNADQSGVTVGTVNALAANAVTASVLASDAGTEIATAVLSAQLVLTGTCDSGSTTTCVDDALNQADSTQIDERLICFDDDWCSLIDSFTPASDTVTTTKTAPSTRASKAYVIFPATAQ